MQNIACQRWDFGRRPSWRRPEDGGFDASRYYVTEIVQALAKPFIESVHYAGTFPASLRNYGMFEADTGRLVGVAVLSVPAQRSVLTSVFPGLEPYTESADLGRFCLLPEVPANGESWMIGEVRRLAAEAGFRGAVMFADPVERCLTDGTVFKPGHWGTIYQASNALYLGRSTPRTLTMLPDATVLSDRAAQKIRAQDRGHEYAEKQLIALGARPVRAGENPTTWLADQLEDIGAVKFRHHGNLRYACALGTTKAARNAVKVAMEPGPYPKRDSPLLAA
jgi:hypothetical protein